MMKGDLRKKQILETAEMLFTERGYDQTGVQDILDRLNLSKGSFYHHFESKALVLQTICEGRAEKAAKSLAPAGQSESGLQWMNRLLSGMIPFAGEGLAFLRMLLPVLAMPEGQSILAAYQAALKQAWAPMILSALQRMTAEGDAFSFYPEETASILADLVNDLWVRMSQEITRQGGQEMDRAFLGRLMIPVDAYRASIENLISAPYGSIELVNLETLAATAEKLKQA